MCLTYVILLSTSLLCLTLVHFVIWLKIKKRKNCCTSPALKLFSLNISYCLNTYRSCTLIEDVLIGDNTQINDHTTVTKSMIGDNCLIGNNVTIRGSQIMNNVVIKDNCKILNSFIDDNVVVEENCSLEAGAILAANVRVKADRKLKGNIIESDDKEKGMHILF